MATVNQETMDVIAAAIIAAQGAAPPAAEQVNAAAVKLPNFLTSRPEHWLTQAEAQFAIRGVTTELTKFYHVVSSFDSAVQERMAPAVAAAPAQGQYEYLKAAVLWVYGRTATSKANEFMASIVSPGLGDRRPSDMLAYLTSIFTSADVFRQVFLLQLPDTVRAQLDGSEDALPELAARADMIIEGQRASSLRPGIVAASSKPTKFAPTARAANTRRALQQRSTFSNFTKSSSAEHLPLPSICWYHSRFGTNAQKCVAPCTFRPHKFLGCINDYGDEGTPAENCLADH